MRPYARQENLIVQDIDDEVIVYDLERHRAHRLSRSTALIWRHCDGHRTVGDLAKVVEAELHTPADDAVVWLVLGELERAHLLSELLIRPKEMARVSRRYAIAAGLAGAAVLLLEGCGVDSITAPTPVPGASPGQLAKEPEAGTCNCIVPLQPPAPKIACDKEGKTEKTHADGTCMGTDPNCPVGDDCKLWATWECQSSGEWLQIKREHNCHLKKPKEPVPSPSPSPSPSPGP